MSMCKKVILLVSFLIVLGCLFSFSSTAKAMTVEEMVALIQKLQQQIADLQKQLAQTQGAPTAWCHTFNKNLVVGANNEEVASLHTVLEKEGFDIFDEEKANKDFGESTASAISGFQQKYADEILKPLGLKYSTGIAGKSTRVKLNALFGCNQKAEPKTFCQQTAVICESSTKIICPTGLDDKGCPFPCKCAPVACAQDVNTCSDGSYVKRVPPSCEFTPCPNQTTTNQPPIIYGANGPTYLKINEIGTWTIKASDPEKGSLDYSVRWGDSELNQAAPSALKSTEQSFTQSSSFTHSYNKIGIYTITIIVTDNQGLAAQTTLNVKVEESAYPTISEQVKCVFKGSQTDQKCYGASSNYTNYNCADKEACVVDVKGKKGERVTWKSTCGGYAYTTVDGQNEYAEFTCGATSASLNVISPNGQEAWELGKAFEIKWKQTQNANVSVIARNKQLPGTGGDLWFNMTVNGSVAGVSGENRVWWDIPNYLNAHTGYEVCVAGSFANPIRSEASNGASATALEDCSDSPFAIHEAIVSDIAKTCSEMLASQQYYFDICNQGGFDNVCFNKFSGIYQGCVRNSRDDCTKYNANAQVNMLCPIATTPTVSAPVTTAPSPTETSVASTCKTITCAAGYVVNYTGEKDQNGCSITKCISTSPTPVSSTPISQKSITLLSPNGGEKLLKGSTYAIKWNSSGVDSVYIKLRKGADTYNGPEGEVAKLMSNAGILLWTVPTTLPDGADYAIRIVDGTATILDDSDSLFSIATQ